VQKEKILFVIILIGWIIIFSTFFHDIIFALKYNMQVPQVKIQRSPIDKSWDSGPIEPSVIDRVFPFCCLSRHQPTEWVSIWKRLQFLIGISIGWICFTLLWFLVKKGILNYDNES